MSKKTETAMSLSAFRPEVFRLVPALKEALTLKHYRRTVAIIIPPPPEVADGLRALFDPVAGEWTLHDPEVPTCESYSGSDRPAETAAAIMDGIPGDAP